MMVVTLSVPVRMQAEVYINVMTDALNISIFHLNATTSKILKTTAVKLPNVTSIQR